MLLGKLEHWLVETTKQSTSVNKIFFGTEYFVENKFLLAIYRRVWGSIEEMEMRFKLKAGLCDNVEFLFVILWMNWGRTE